MVEYLKIMEPSQAPLAAYLVGSCAAGSQDSASDVDMILVQGDHYDRRFHLAKIEGQVWEIECLGALAFASYVKQYYWYARDLVAELGKFVTARTLVPPEREDLRRVHKALQRPALHVRRFIVDYHLGSLIRYRKDLSRGNQYLGTHAEWSVLSVFAGLWGSFPASMTARAFHSCLSQHQADVFRSWADPKSVCDQWQGFIELVRDEVASHLGPRTGPLFYPQDLAGRQVLASKDELDYPVLLSAR